MASQPADASKLQEFRQRAEDAEQQIKVLKERLNVLESQLDAAEAKSNLQLGAPSSMNDDFQLNLRYLCDRAARVQPDSEIVTRIANGQYHRMTYLQAQQIGTRLASALNKLGIKIGDRVATFMWNNGRHMCLYYAVPSMGAVLHTLNIRLAKADLTYIINHAQDKVIFVDATILPLFEKGVDLDTLNKVAKVVVCGPNEQPANWTSSFAEKHADLVKQKFVDFDDFLKTGDDSYDWPELDERSGAALCYTSGTTGNAKGVMYSHRSCYLHALMMMSTDLLNISGADSVLPVVPMFHVLSWCTPFTAYCLGFKYVLYNCYRNPDEFLSMVGDESVTCFLGVPTVLNGIKLLLDNQETFDKYADSLKTWTRSCCGGSAPAPSMIKWYWDKLNVEVIHGWGMTELNPVGSIARRVSRRCDLTKTEEEKYQNQLPQGLIAPLVQAKIVRPDNYAEELKHDGEAMGELLVRGPCVCKKYYAVDAQHKFYNGWLLTGDIASINELNVLQLRDRSKDLIKSGGEWISSVALENEISGMDGVDKAAVIGVKHPKFQERPIVVIQMKDDIKDDESKRPSLQQVREFLLKTEKFAKFQLPDDVVFDDVPLTGTGKMNKRELREKLEKENYVLPDLK